MAKEKKVLPAAITIFGAKGDLTRRKLIPSFYNLYIDNHLPANFHLFCVDYLPVTTDAYRDYLRENVDQFSRTGKTDSRKWQEFASRVSYIQGDFTKPDTYGSIKGEIRKFETTEKV